MSIPAMTSSFDAEMCRKALRILFEPDAVVELRAFGGRNGTKHWDDPVGGFYDDHTRLVQDAGRINGNYAGVYVTLNPPWPETLAWSKNRLTGKPRKLTGDTHVVSRRWLYLDFDPVRMSDVSATGDEQEAAFCRAREVREWLTSRDWPEPVRASSGNGAHLLYRIDEPNSDESRQLVMDCLKALSFRFSDDKVDVDVKTGNASRIVKLYGSLACKGDEIEGRPHRLSSIIHAPDPADVVTTNQLHALAGLLPADPPLATSSNGSATFDLDVWMVSSGLEVAKEGTWDTGGYRWILRHCPWNPDHTNLSAYVCRLPSGAIAAGCHHNGCNGKSWHALRDVVEPDWRNRRRSSSPNPVGDPQTGTRELDHSGEATGRVDQLAAPIGGQPANWSVPLVRQSAGDLRTAYSPTTWIVDQILPLGGVGLIAGQPGIGKTWLSLDLAYAVAAGEKWIQNFPCRKAKVLVILGEEDSNSLVERLDLIYDGRGFTYDQGDTLPVEFLVQQPVRILDDESLLDSQLEETVRDFQPGLVIIDPMRRVHGTDENDSGAMSALFAAFRQLAAIPESTCAILVVHHLRKRSEFDEGLDRLRGSSDIAASVDSVLEVSGDFDTLKIRHAKSKRGPAQESFLVRSEVDEDGARLRFVNPEEKAEEEREEARAAILDVIRGAGMEGANRSRLAEILKPRGVGKERIKKITEELVEEGVITKEHGKRNAIIHRMSKEVGAGTTD